MTPYYDAVRSFDPTMSQEDFFKDKPDADLVSQKTKRKLYNDLKRQKNALLKEEAKAARKAAKAAEKAAKEAEEAEFQRKHGSELNYLFNLWQVLFDRRTSSFTKSRKHHVALARKKFTLEQCELVLRTAAADPNTRGRNKLNRPFDDLPNIFRNEERVEMYLRMAQLADRRTPNLVPDEGPARSERY